MDQSAVVADRVRKTYGPNLVLNDLSLEIKEGEIFGLLGPNGAGKTTFVEILEGLRGFDSGSVSVLGQNPAKATRRWRDQIGVVFQNGGAHRDWTVGSVIREYARYYSNPMNPEHVLHLVGLTEHVRKRTNRLSGGLQRRVDVALGIIGNPRLLFMDEPTTGFDPEIRREFWQIIHDINEAGTTILLTSHYLDEIEALASRVAVLNRGVIVTMGPPDDIGADLGMPSTVKWRDEDGDHSLTTDSPEEHVLKLAEKERVQKASLTVIRPDLEDRYLALIGRDKLDEK